MADTDARPSRLKTLEDDLARLRPDYEAAKKQISAPEIQARREVAWTDLRTLLDSVQAGGVTGETALFMLGQAQQLVRGATPITAYRTIAEYDQLRERIRKLEMAVPKVTETSA